MKISNLGLVPLGQASLCLDCEMITTAHTNCAACGSRALLNVARALSRPGYSARPCPAKTVATESPTKHARQRDFFQSVSLRSRHGFSRESPNRFRCTRAIGE